MDNVIKNTFGSEKMFMITCEIDTSNEQYFFSKMAFFLKGKKLCNEENQVFVLNYALSAIKEFLVSYKSKNYIAKSIFGHIKKRSLNYSIDKVFTQLVKNQQSYSLQLLEGTSSKVGNKLYDELDEIYLNFEWEPFIGYMFHFMEYEKNEILFWDDEKNGEFSSVLLTMGEFHLVLEEFYYWADSIVNKKIS